MSRGSTRRRMHRHWRGCGGSTAFRTRPGGWRSRLPRWHGQGLASLSLLDIACGGGEVPIGVARELRRSGIAVHLTLLDRSASAVGQAVSAARAAGMEAVRGVIADAGGEIAGLMMPGSFDVVTNSLFLHHLPDSAAVMRLLAGMRQVAGRLMVISDLRRCRAGFAAAWLGCRVLSRSRVVHHDGPVSVRAAWSIEELRTFAERAGLANAAIERCRPWRMRVVWHAPRAQA